ncbi:MAG: arsenate reductase (glutaredoxin) [Bacteroidales bacterium]|jgi:arsenate reductase|nr:arsenate reductase (glutaredoxin) [Bacteroidales bacterium]
MAYQIYHNTRCKKSRGGLKYLEDKGIKPEIIEYLKDQPFTEESLTELLRKLNMKPREIIRTQEKEYKENYKGKNLTDEEWIKILVENPKLIRRPVIVKENKAVIGDPVENIDPIL